MITRKHDAEVRVLYCHGLESGPTGYKVRVMKEQGLVVNAPSMEMSLFDPRARNGIVRSLFSPRLLIRWPWQWLSKAMEDSFAACVEVQRIALRDAAAGSFDILVGSSWGGAVATALIADGSWTGPALLLCPALRVRDRWAGTSHHPSLSTDAIIASLAALPPERKARLLLVHGTSDATVPIDDSRALSAATGITLEVIENGSHGLGCFVEDGRMLQLIRRLLTTGGGDVPQPQPLPQLQPQPPPQGKQKTLVARRPMLPVNACADGVELVPGDRLVWHFRHGESTANLAGKAARAADTARGDGEQTFTREHEADVTYADAPLTATGMQQASERRTEIAGWSIRPTLIVSSPLTRALQTAAIIFDDDIKAGVPLVVRPELREFFPNLAQDRGRTLAALRADEALSALPNSHVVLAALSDDATAEWRHEWDAWQACAESEETGDAAAEGDAWRPIERTWQAHSADGGRIGAFKAWLATQPHTRVATVSHFGTCNALVNHEPCVEASGLARKPAEEIGMNAFAWRLGVLPMMSAEQGGGQRGTRVEMPNCGHVALVYSEEDP